MAYVHIISIQLVKHWVFSFRYHVTGRSSHNELLDDEQQATGCTCPTLQQSTPFTVHCYCMESHHCSMESDCGCSLKDGGKKRQITDWQKKSELVWLRYKHTHQLLLCFWQRSFFFARPIILGPVVLNVKNPRVLPKQRRLKILRIYLKSTIWMIKNVYCFMV